MNKSSIAMLVRRAATVTVAVLASVTATGITSAAQALAPGYYLNNTVYFGDSNRDGQSDYFWLDLNRDRRWDTYGRVSGSGLPFDEWMDGNQNGKWELYGKDLSGDGIPDQYWLDANEDGKYESTFLDWNHNGVDDNADRRAVAGTVYDRYDPSTVSPQANLLIGGISGLYDGSLNLRSGVL